MDETTMKVMVVMQTRLQLQMLSLLAVVARPIPGVPLPKQWTELLQRLEVKTQETNDIGLKQIRLLAEMMETKDEKRKEEIRRELAVLDGLIQSGLAGLWNVPPRPEKSQGDS